MGALCSVPDFVLRFIVFEGEKWPANSPRMSEFTLEIWRTSGEINHHGHAWFQHCKVTNGTHQHKESCLNWRWEGNSSEVECSLLFGNGPLSITQNALKDEEKLRQERRVQWNGGEELKSCQNLGSVCWHSKNIRRLSLMFVFSGSGLIAWYWALWKCLCNRNKAALDCGKNLYAMELGKAST